MKQPISIFFTGLGVFMALAIIGGNVFAEMVRGQVTAVNKQNQSITVATQDNEGSAQETKELKLAPGAQFSGIQSIDDLEVGDSIQADVEKKMFGGDQIKQLTSTGASAAAANANQNLGKAKSSLQSANKAVTREAGQGQSALTAQKPTAQSNSSNALNSSAQMANADVESRRNTSANLSTADMSGDSETDSRSNTNTQY